MTFNFMRQDLAIDLGTANTVISHNDKIILDEPSIIAVTLPINMKNHIHGRQELHKKKEGG